MRKILLYFGLLFGLYLPLFAQIQEITNVLTPQHQEVKGTKFALILPDTSFHVSYEFTGFSSSFLQSGINFTEMPMPFVQLLPMLMKDVKEKDSSVLIHKDLKINGLQAKLLKMRMTERSVFEELENAPAPDKILWTLICGDEKMSMIVVAGYATTLDAQYAAKFEQSLLSFLYSLDKQVNPLEQLSFGVNIENTPLKFATIMMQTGALFNLSGEFPPQKSEDAVYMIFSLPFEIEKSEEEERAKETVKKKYKDEDVEIESATPIKVGELFAYEVIAYRKKGKKKEELIYGALILDKDRHFQVSASAKKDTEKYLNLFAEVTRSFQVK